MTPDFYPLIPAKAGIRKAAGDAGVLRRAS